MPDYRFSDEIMMSEGLMDVPMFSIPLPFAMAAHMAQALTFLNMEDLHPEIQQTVQSMYSMFLEHALNNYPNNLESSDSF